MDLDDFFLDDLFLSVDWFVIMIVWAAAWILSSNIDYLLARLYDSSIVVGGCKNSNRKKGVDGPKLLLKFWRTVSMIYDSTC